MLFCEQASLQIQASRAAMPSFTKHPQQQVTQSQTDVDRWGVPLSQPHPGHQGSLQFQQPQPQQQQQQHLEHQDGQYGRPSHSNDQQSAHQVQYQNHQQEQSLQRLRPGQDDAKSTDLGHTGAVDSHMGTSPGGLASEAFPDRGPQTQRLFQQNGRVAAVAASTALAGAAAVDATSQGAFAPGAATQVVRSSAHLPRPLFHRVISLKMRPMLLHFA